MNISTDKDKGIFPLLSIHVSGIHHSTLHTSFKFFRSSCLQVNKTSHQDDIRRINIFKDPDTKASSPYRAPVPCFGCCRPSPETRRRCSRTRPTTWTGASPPAGCARAASCTTRNTARLCSLQRRDTMPHVLFRVVNIKPANCSQMVTLGICKILSQNVARNKGNLSEKNRADSPVV